MASLVCAMEKARLRSEWPIAKVLELYATATASRAISARVDTHHRSTRMATVASAASVTINALTKKVNPADQVAGSGRARAVLLRHVSDVLAAAVGRLKSQDPRDDNGPRPRTATESEPNVLAAGSPRFMIQVSDAPLPKSAASVCALPSGDTSAPLGRWRDRRFRTAATVSPRAC